MDLSWLLPSRASAPAHCRECDGPRDLPGLPECSECEGAGLLQRLEWRYQNGEGIAQLYAAHGVELGREFHPLEWHFGVSLRLGAEPFLGLSFGPWSFTVARDL